MMDGRTITRLRGIDVAIDCDGIAMPWGITDPVEIGGAVVTRATFPNAAFLRDNEVHIGDALALGGDGKTAVVEEVLTLLRTGEEQSLRLPNACPLCGCDLRQLGDDLVCPSSSCEAQLALRVEKLVAPQGFDIPELDRETIRTLIAARLITTPSDVFRLRDGALLREGWTIERVNSLAQSIERSKNVPLERLLIAMTGIEAEAAASIAEHARSLASVKRLAAGSMARLPNVGTRAAEQVVNFMREPRNRRVLAQMARAGVTTLRVPVAYRAVTSHGDPRP
jgi:DNA ligase (NAD+)